MKNLLVALAITFSLSVISGEIHTISPEQVLERDTQVSIVVDVRSPEEFAEGHVPGAINIPHTEIDKSLENLMSYADKTIILYCHSGRRAGIAANYLEENGVTKLQHMAGDMLEWKAKQFPLEK
jgi:phage shock protein E